MNPPYVSVISIALKQEEFEPIRIALDKQTYRDFEFVGEVGGSIPSAWNRAIARASGEILVFTETDAFSVNEFWLEQLVRGIPDDKTVVKGLEVSSHEWNMSNLAGHRGIFAGLQFDESFKWAEDTDYFCQIKKNGYQLIQLDQAPVIHLRNFRSRKMIRRAFQYGLYWAKIRNSYGDPVEVSSLTSLLRMLMMIGLQFMGMMLGTLIYLPERTKRTPHVRS
jgi:hypothetical protein